MSNSTVATRSPVPENSRFELRRKLGAGSFGTVYEAFDRDYQSVVALKVLHRNEPAALLRFKHEFRLLSNLVHPNLVTLYELFSERNEWFFTMERVEGTHFLDYIRATSNPADEVASDDETVTMMPPRVDARGVTSTPETPGTRPVDFERLRSAFLLLAQAVRALHSARVLHRDLKPSNVLVTPAGRVVVLDFGLAKELSGTTATAGVQSNELAGSPAYMSPEQWLLKPLTEATDWYSVGVMLFEALTQRRPFASTSSSERVQEQLRGAPDLTPYVAGAPAELVALCRQLLHPEAAARPSSDEIIRRLESPHRPALPFVPAAASGEERRLVGRDTELAALEESFRYCVRNQAPAVAFVHGTSGMGKSALLRTFTRSLEERGEALVLKGRCHERESMPYKAFDGLVDSLGRILNRAHQAGGNILAPRGMAELIRLFPVLKPSSLAAVLANETPAVEPHEVRHRALRAFKELLAYVAFDRPLVLWVDDLQWGDVDGVRLLAELVTSSGVLPLLLVASYREEDAGGSPCLMEFRRLITASQAAMRDIPVVALGQEDAERLARECLGSTTDEGRRQAADIAREAEGSPFFVEELARYTRLREERGEATSGSGGALPSIRELLRGRVTGLPEQARRLLELVAVASRPLERRVALEAAGLGEASLSSMMLLRTHHLLRIHSGGEETPLEIAHDRLREGLLADMGAPVLVEHHQRLAMSLLATTDPNPEELARHFHGAGELPAAARYAYRAARRADTALAFTRAAELYGSALEWSQGRADPELPEVRALELHRARALIHAGQGAAAASRLLQLAEGAPREEALEFKRRAAVQYLATGLQHEGVDVLRSLVKEVGLGYPETPARAILSIVWWLTRLKVRGHGFQARDVAQLAPDVLARLDMCWNVGKVLSNTDPLRGMPFQLRAVMMALEAGEPIRVARALGMLGAMFVWQGTPSTMAQGGALLDRAEALARDVTDDEARRLLVTAQAARDLVRGDWNVALERLEPAFRESQTVAIDPWDVYMMRVFINNALFGMGRLAEAHERAGRWFREASEQGNTYGRTTAVACWGTTLLAIRGPEEARARLREVQESWPKEGFRVPDVYALQLETNCSLYEGRPAEAWSRLKQVWPAMERSGLLRAQIVRLEMYSLRARAAVALAAVGGNEREKLLDSAMRDVHRVEQESRRDARPMSRLLRAGIDSVRGNSGSALEHLTAAGEGFAAAGMELWAAHARVFQGVLLGGDAGRELRASADAVIARQGILAPGRWLRLQVPGLEGLS